MEKESTKIVDFLSKIKNRKNNLDETSNIQTRRRAIVKHWLISKAGSDCTIDQEVFSLSNDGKIAT